MKNPVFLALDVNDWGRAHELAQELKDMVGGFKVGPRLSVGATPLDWQKLVDLGPVFYDPKYYDIPNTMVESIKACADSGISYVTIHAGSGKKAMEQVARLENQIQTQRLFKVLCVTVLTSFDSVDNPIPGFKNEKIEEAVLNLAGMVYDSGLSGVVCSGQEVQSIKKKYPQLFAVVPGIRLPEDSPDDQARVLGPNDALELGADALVVGRSVINEVHPSVKMQKYLDLLP